MPSGVVVGLLAAIAILLLLCLSVLRSLWGEVRSLSMKIGSFLYEYERLNNFEERKQISTEATVDRRANR